VQVPRNLSFARGLGLLGWWSGPASATLEPNAGMALIDPLEWPVTIGNMLSSCRNLF
jgi:hypothetical protein